MVHIIDIKSGSARRRAPGFTTMDVIIVNFVDDSIFHPLAGF
jgi:hypothetical protein